MAKTMDALEKDLLQNFREVLTALGATNQEAKHPPLALLSVQIIAPGASKEAQRQMAGRVLALFAATK